MSISLVIFNFKQRSCEIFVETKVTLLRKVRSTETLMCQIFRHYVA
jgi:hypothetical protein